MNRDWNNLPVADITRQQIHAALDGCMAEGKRVEANRRYSALRTYFGWLHSREYVSENPMLGVQKPFDGETPSDRYWKDQEIAALWNCADEFDDYNKTYLRLLILLGHRPMEIGSMRWGDLDLENAIWNLGSKHKAGWKSGRKAVTPLPEVAVEMLQKLPRVRDNPYVFPGRGDRDGNPNPQSRGTGQIAPIRTASGIADFDFKTARATVRTGLEQLDIPPHEIDACLNHGPTGSGRKFYGKYTYEKQQREAFDQWADHVLTCAETRAA